MTSLIIGAGSIGSNVAHMLASMGMGRVEFLDFDNVGVENLYPAFFGMDDVGLSKVAALERRLVEMFELDCESIYDQIDDRDGMGWLPDKAARYDFVVLATDTLRSRAVAWDILIDHTTWFIDARIGGYLATVFAVSTSNPKTALAHWRSQLDQPHEELPCGMKATAPLTKGYVPGMVGQVVLSVAAGRPVPYMQQEDLYNAFHLVVWGQPS